MSSPRVESLDVFRGAAIAGMLLVNNPGSWAHIYDPLEHAAWNGWTFTDLIFPFFLFIVGVAMMYSFPKRRERGASRRGLLGHVARRALALMILGWWGGSWTPLLWPGSESVLARPGAEGAAVAAAVLLRVAYPVLVLAAVVLLAGTKHPRRWRAALGVAVGLFIVSGTVLDFADPLFDQLAGIRIPGVLVRIGVCYLLASVIYFLTPSPRLLVRWIAVLLIAYAVWMTLVPVPGYGMPDLDRAFPTLETPPDELFSNWAFFIDHHVFGAHTWSQRQLVGPDGRLVWSFDPEGLISTIPATCTVLFGVLTGLWMRRSDRTES
ncbi:MAG TPA: DUF5009 domain-containing protein, partial [Longimicrobiales bacterium]|nr:DUF5009 domain-containing protein [Longimicrobiales bacterium]